jgi:hypothetical protein
MYNDTHRINEQRNKMSQSELDVNVAALLSDDSFEGLFMLDSLDNFEDDED